MKQHEMNPGMNRQVRTYALANRLARNTVDLRNYESVIVGIVQSVIPNVKVDVNKDAYTVHGICRGEAIKIGKLLFSVFGSEFAATKYVLFISVDEDDFSEDALYYPDVCS